MLGGAQVFSGRRITLVQSKHSQWYVEPKMLMAIGDHWCSFGRWGTAGTMVDRIGYSGSVGGISSQSYVLVLSGRLGLVR